MFAVVHEDATESAVGEIALVNADAAPFLPLRRYFDPVLVL